ncbi:MAG TPA: hypothetical protein VHN14_14360 [Kofleriaceae bacterium]|jgi:hypothetical protein|nr:hypothetical protein [Kofleriaceae bacterium]
MSLEGVHRFLTVFLRNPAMRADILRGVSDDQLRSLGVDDPELPLVRAIDLNVLYRSARGLADERRGRRRQEFTQFIDYLEQFIPMEPFWEGFEQAYPSGTLHRMEEVRRFSDYATRFLLESPLPPFLLDLMQFNLHTTSLSEAPRVQIEGALDDDAIGDMVLPSDEIALREPYRVVEFRCDVIRIASQSLSQLGGPPPYQPTTLFIQKDWSQPKTARAIPLEELPMFRHLRERALVHDRIAQFDRRLAYSLIGHLRELAHRGIIHVFRKA